jgi:hypothetical protein
MMAKNPAATKSETDPQKLYKLIQNHFSIEQHTEISVILRSLGKLREDVLKAPPRALVFGLSSTMTC